MWYLNKEAHLFGRCWAADEAKQIHLSLKDNVFEELKVSLQFLTVIV